MKTRLIAALGFFVLMAAAANAQTAGWLRYPSISPDGKTVVFTYKGDLYRVASTGGAAVALTTHQAHDFMPVWSHDGKQIAFASDRSRVERAAAFVCADALVLQLRLEIVPAAQFVATLPRAREDGYRRQPALPHRIAA